jgi:hypothetical protein
VRRLVVGAVVVAVAAAALAWVLNQHPQPAPGCAADVAGATYALDPEQAANAATIAVVGKRLRMPDHAVTVALATALQESKLHNVRYGDLDSLGLFQQRPSQGWGTGEQILHPAYAAQAFFRHLAQVPGWQTLSVADAAQAVQHSAGGYAYAQWEPQARALARALTGEVPAGLRCVFATPRTASGPAPEGALREEFGGSAVGVPLDGARGWMVASWLVAHAYDYGITEVQWAGQRWTSASGRWRPAGASPAASSAVHYRRAPQAHSSA